MLNGYRQRQAPITTQLENCTAAGLATYMLAAAHFWNSNLSFFSCCISMINTRNAASRHERGRVLSDTRLQFGLRIVYFWFG